MTLAMARTAENPRTARSLRDDLDLVLPSLRARALKLSKNPVEADDLVQDAVERALRFEASFEPGTNLRAWLQQILYSVFITRCRRSRRERHALDTLLRDPCEWTHQDGAPPMQALSRRLSGVLDALPPRFADVVRLVDLEGRAYKDAAVALSVPVGTVMSRLFRGRRLLAAALTDPERGPLALAARLPEAA